jgi:hypothetical protein
MAIPTAPKLELLEATEVSESIKLFYRLYIILSLPVMVILHEITDSVVSTMDMVIRIKFYLQRKQDNLLAEHEV